MNGLTSNVLGGSETILTLSLSPIAQKFYKLAKESIKRNLEVIHCKIWCGSYTLSYSSGHDTLLRWRWYSSDWTGHWTDMGWIPTDDARVSAGHSRVGAVGTTSHLKQRTGSWPANPYWVYLFNRCNVTCIIWRHNFSCDGKVTADGLTPLVTVIDN